jgi:hypothetical protein
MLSAVLRSSLGALLLLSAFSKVTNYRWFVKAVERDEFLPGRVPLQMLAIAIIVAEGSIGAWLVAGGGEVKFVAFSAALLFLVFSAAVTRNLLQGRSDVACGCSGFNKAARVGVPLVVQNVAFSVTSVACAEGSMQGPLLSVAATLILVSWVMRKAGTLSDGALS